MFRYSDFVVDEIDLEGRVATLTSVLYDESCKPKEVAISEDAEPTAEDYTVKLAASLSDLLSEEEISSIVEFSAGNDEEEPMVTKAIGEKTDRTKFHSVLREVFGGRLVTDTVGEAIRIAHRSTKDADRKRARLDKRNFQDPNRLPCVRFVLKKEFMETLEASQLIAKKIGLNPKDINAAGTKDKRAITTQFMSARHINPERLAAVNGMAGGKIRISNIEKWEGEPLRMGDLTGNKFTLLLREIDGDEDQVKTNVESLKEHGFVNYFGLQRFGTMCVKSHDIGMKLLQGQWQEAIDLILGERVDETDGLAKEARRLWAQKKDAKAAHDLFPFRYNAERQILWHFHKQSNHNDLVGALLSISRDLRLMYVHSVQSLVWNRLVSERLFKFGREPVVGDLVMGKGLPPTVLTEETVSKYTIFDVAMPMPGYDVKSPGGPVGLMYKELVEKEFHLMGEDCFQPKQKGLWDLPGAYRLMLTHPQHVTCAVGHYPAADTPIIKSEDLSEAAEFKGALVTFALPSSSYATMALREIMDQPART